MKNIIYISLLIFGLHNTGFSQDNSTGPRGGRLKAVSYYYVEVLECYEFLEIYLYDADMCAIRNNSLGGNAVFYFSDKSNISVILFAYGADGFTAEVKQQCYEGCEININGIGLSLKTTFSGFGEENEDCKRPDNYHIQN